MLRLSKVVVEPVGLLNFNVNVFDPAVNPVITKCLDACWERVEPWFNIKALLSSPVLLLAPDTSKVIAPEAFLINDPQITNAFVPVVTVTAVPVVKVVKDVEDVVSSACVKVLPTVNELPAGAAQLGTPPATVSTSPVPPIPRRAGVEPLEE
jgi:hypothetical protein